MSVVQLPPSYNLTDVKPASSAGGQAVYSKIRSDNSTYSAGDVLRLTIPTGNNMFLSAPDSFITGKIKPTITGGAGAGTMRVDGSIYSIFKRITVYHGSSMIENILNANRLYNALYDVQCGPSERTSGSINLLVDELGGIGYNNYTYGAIIASGSTYSFSLCLPSILGSFSEKAVPLAMMGAAELYIEIELEAGVRVFTSRTPDSVGGTIGAYTTAPTAVTYEISEFYYNACITNLSADVTNVLKQAMMSRPVILPCISYRGEQRVISASATSFSDKFSFQFSSCKGLMWWLTNGSTANGAVVSTNYNAAVTTRAPGDLNEWWISLNGQDFPPSHIKAGQESGTRINGAEAFAHLERYLNQNAAAGLQSVLTKELYCHSLTTAVSDGNDAKKFVAAVSCDRFDNENQRQLSGINSMSSQVQIAMQFTTGVTESMNLYAFAMFDLGLELVDGLLIARY